MALAVPPREEDGVQHVQESTKAPSYARANITSRLPDYTNSLAEAVKAAFTPNNYVSLTAMHTKYAGPNAEFSAPGFRPGGAGGQQFSEFNYVCSPFDFSEELRSRERREHDSKVRSIAGDQAFFAGSNLHREKFEEFGFEYLSEPYNNAVEEQRREKWIQEQKSLVRTPFIPSGVQKALERPTRGLLGDLMTVLYRTLTEDWPETGPTVLSTAEDLIVIYFAVERVRNTTGLLTYMNNALRRDDTIVKYELRKVVEGWNVLTKDNHLMFTLRPPWVKSRNFLPSNPQQTQGGGEPKGN